MFSALQKHPLFIVLSTAILLRIGLAFALQRHLDGIPSKNFLIEGDANGYWELGEKLAVGEEFAVHEPPRKIMRMPGFPLLLSVAGGNFLVARILLSVVGTLGCFLVYLLGRELVDRRTGLWAAGLAAFSPTFCGFSVLILSETAFATSLLLSLLLLQKWIVAEKEEFPKATFSIALGAGIAAAFACYMRPSWLLFGPVCVLLVFLNHRFRRRTLFSGLLFFVGFAVALLPWIVRNYNVSGKIVVTTLWVGPSLYDGLNANASGDSDMRFYEEDGLSQQLSEYEIDRLYRNKAWKFAKENPGKTIQLCVKKLARFWKPWPNAAQFQNVGTALPVAGFYLLLMLPACVGWWKSRKDFWCWFLTIGPVLYFSAIHSIFVGSVRYRLPAEYPLCVLAAVGMVHLMRFKKPRESRRDS